MQNDRPRAHLGAITDLNRAQQLGVRAQENVVAHLGVPGARKGLGLAAAQGYPVQNRDVIPHHRRFPDHHPVAVIDEDVVANRRRRVDFHLGKKAAQTSYQRGQQVGVMLVQPMTEPIPP